MLTNTEIKEFARRWPFAPFRLELSDGTSYDVRHPDAALVTATAVVVGVPGEGMPDDEYERTHYLALEHIVKLIPLPSKAPSA